MFRLGRETGDFLFKNETSKLKLLVSKMIGLLERTKKGGGLAANTYTAPI